MLKLSAWIVTYCSVYFAPMQIDIFAGVRSALDSFVYNIAFSLAGIHWGILRALVMAGHLIERINIWLTEQAFSPLIAMNNEGMRVAFTLAFVIALFVLGITYMIAVFIRLDVVNFQSAVTWYIAGALFFAVGPSLYRGMNDLRNTVSNMFYISTLNGIQSDDGGAFSLGAVQTADLGLAPLCDYLGMYLQNATLSTNNIDGLDVALAYLHADGVDVMGYYAPLGYGLGCPVHLRDPHNGNDVSTIPTDWFYEGNYFDFTQSPESSDWEDESVNRSAAIQMGWQAHGRMLTAWPLILFGIVEQTVYLLLTIAMGITFMIFGVVVLFGFFRRTEGIANAVVNQWIELIVQTVIIGMMQALVVGFFLMGTVSGNALVVLAVGLVCLLLMIIVLWSGIKAVWGSLNRLFDAFGQGAGKVFVRPGQSATLAAGMAGYSAAQAGTIASGASSALTGLGALRQGATPMQAAGLSFGGSAALSGAMRAIARTPGLRDGQMGEAAEQFLEGASARTIAKSVPKAAQWASGLNLRGGVSLLSDRSEGEETMLIPAVGARLESWTGGRPRMGEFTPDTANTNREIASTEMVGEELEQHISEVSQGSDSRLERAAQSLEQAAQSLTRGTVQVSGNRDVAGTVADAMRLLGKDRTDAGGTKRDSVDNLTAGRYVAEAMGVRPVADRAPLGGQDLARLGMFINQAQSLGLSPRQAEGVIRDVKESPDGRLKDNARETLVQVVQGGGKRSWDDARRQVEKLEGSAARLPQNISAYGEVDDPMKKASAMGGSGSVLA